MNSGVEEVVNEATVGGGEGEDHSDQEFVDAAGDHDNDITRPCEWSPRDQDTDDDKSEDKSEVYEDSTGNSPTSPDFVDERILEKQEETLSTDEKEEKREEANKLKLEGNSLYKEGKTQDAVEKYTTGLRICPLCFKKERAVLYANRGQMKKVLGLNDQAVKNCTKAIELDPEYLKAILRRAEVYEETEKLDESLEDYKKVLELNPRHVEANRAVKRLPPKIEERNEKLKAEMMDSLKKLGNMVLKPFGLSTNNFQMEQDPVSGGYNIQFKQSK